MTKKKSHPYCEPVNIIHMWQSGIVNYILHFEHMTVFESLYGGAPSKDGADTWFKTESFQRHITKCV